MFSILSFIIFYFTATNKIEKAVKLLELIGLSTVRIGRIFLVNAGANFIELTVKGIISIDRVPGINFIRLNQETFELE